MKKSGVVRAVVGWLFIGTGFVSLTLAPDSDDILRPDTAGTLAFGLGLGGAGVLCLFITKRRAAVVALAIPLLWSVLSNLVLLANMRTFREYIVGTPATEARTAQYYLSILESDEGDAKERLSSILEDAVKRGEVTSEALKRSYGVD